MENKTKPEGWTLPFILIVNLKRTSKIIEIKHCFVYPSYTKFYFNFNKEIKVLLMVQPTTTSKKRKLYLIIYLLINYYKPFSFPLEKLKTNSSS